MLQKYLFTESELTTTKEIIFNASPLGQLRKVLPLEELSLQLPLKKHPQGAMAWFDRQGMLALLFLKAYTGLSDASLIEHLNGNWQMQLFCGILLPDHRQIADETLVSRIRSKVAKHLDLSVFQRELLQSWKADLRQTTITMQDATVYESYIKYPTEAKLLWDCCQFYHDFYQQICRNTTLKAAKSSFEAQRKKQRTFSLLRKKSHKKKQRRRSQLLKLLKRLGSLIQPILEHWGDKLHLPEGILARYKTVQQIMAQQQFLHDNPGKTVSGKIVSLYKPYIRPIVRGKENKPVEFGIKVHMIQVDGINVIEHYDYEAYNECKRLKPAVLLHKELFGSCLQLAADRIYATNENRTYLREKEIAHNFIPKGKGDTAQKKQLRQVLNTARSTILEGSFGNEKNHYGLRKVAARNKANETLWVFLGVMTANAVKIAKRRAAEASPHQTAA
jgi:hypothetical protein